ncbi:MAG: TRAP transporter large permease subunit, partial [Myxococcota bacterium]
IFIVNLEIGYLTPPIGLNLFVASTLFRRSLGEVIVAVLPTLVIMFIGLLLITWIPPLSTGLVRFLEGDSSTESVPPPSGPAIPHQPAQDVPPAGSGGRVKSLQELMQEQRGGGDAEGPSSSSARVKTLQELMAEQRANQASPTAEQKPVSRVKTLQELMAEQRERNGAVQTGSTDDGGTP